MITFIMFCLLVYAAPYIVLLVFIIGIICGLLDK